MNDKQLINDPEALQSYLEEMFKQIDLWRTELGALDQQTKILREVWTDQQFEDFSDQIKNMSDLLEAGIEQLKMETLKLEDLGIRLERFRNISSS